MRAVEGMANSMFHVQTINHILTKIILRIRIESLFLNGNAVNFAERNRHRHP